MSFNTTVPAEKQQNTEKFAFAIKYLKQGWDAQAFQILSQSGSENIPAARFALGICYLRAGNPSSAIQCFEQALQLLRSSAFLQSGTAAANGKSENSETYIRLAAKQIDEEIYLNPMDVDFCKFFPKVAEQAVLLALIHAYKRKGMVEAAQKLSSGLTGPVFEAYKNKLMEQK
jgi:tetratricopeptide (TPR) repeat protein